MKFGLVRVVARLLVVLRKKWPMGAGIDRSILRKARQIPVKLVVRQFIETQVRRHRIIAASVQRLVPISGKQEIASLSNAHSAGMSFVYRRAVLQLGFARIGVRAKQQQRAHKPERIMVGRLEKTARDMCWYGSPSIRTKGWLVGYTSTA